MGKRNFSSQYWKMAWSVAGLVGLTTFAAVSPAGAEPTAPAFAGVTSLTGVACPTAQTCVTVGTGGRNGNLGRSAVIDVATSAVTLWSGSLFNQDLNAVACAPGATTCLTVADDGVASLTVSTGAMTVTAKPAPPTGGIMAMSDIACASATACYAVGFQGPYTKSNAVVVTLSGAGKVLKRTIDTGTGIGAIACPSSTTCLLSDYKSPLTSIQVMTSGTIGSSNPLPADTYVQEIACFEASVCYALAGNSTSSVTNEVIPLNPVTGVPGSALTIGGGFSATSLACSSATVCVLVGFVGSGATAKAVSVLVIKGVAKTPVDRPAAQYLSRIACATATVCYAVGGNSSTGVVVKVGA